MECERAQAESTRNQCEQITLERDTLQKQVQKLSYRIHHLQQHVTVQGL